MLSVGLDLSSKKITIVEMLKSRKDMQIKNAAQFEVPNEAMSKGEIQDPVVLSKRLQEAWRKYKISGRNVQVGISNLKAIVKEVELPLVDDADISKSLKYQINDFIPIPKDNILYDYYVMDKGKDNSKIMLVGAMKSMIFDVIESIKGAGLIAQSIDLNCFSLYRSLDRIYNLKKNSKSYCAINVGPAISIIEIIKNSILKYPRFVSNSINIFIENMERTTGLERDDLSTMLFEFDFGQLLYKATDQANGSDSGNKKEIAERETGKPEPIKSKSEISSKKPDENSGKEEADIKKSDKSVKEDIKKSIKSTADNMINEIKMSIEHYLHENNKNKIDSILLSGEKLKNFDKYIRQETSYKVDVVNIQDNFDLGLLRKNLRFRDQDPEKFINILAIGMALRGFEQ